MYCSVSCGKKEIFFKTALNGFKLAYATKTMMNGIKVCYSSHITSSVCCLHGKVVHIQVPSREYIVSLSFKQLKPFTFIFQRPSTKGRPSNDTIGIRLIRAAF